MEEDEFKNYDIEYPKLSHDHDPVIDYCYGMQYAIIYHSEHRQTGLTLDDCAGKYDMATTPYSPITLL